MATKRKVEIELEKRLKDAILAKYKGTDLAHMLVHNRGDFTWGKFIKLTEIGDIQIVEHCTFVKDGVRVTDRVSSKKGYHPFVKGSDLSHGYDNIYQAVVYAIERMFTNDPNGKLTHYFFITLRAIQKLLK